MLRWHFVMVPLLISAVTLVGCAKRPATTQVSAPAPLRAAAGAGTSDARDVGQGSGQGAGEGGVATGEDAADRGQAPAAGDQTAMQGRDRSGRDGSEGSGASSAGAGQDVARGAGRAGAEGADAGAMGPGGSGPGDDPSMAGAAAAGDEAAAARGREGAGRDGSGPGGKGAGGGDGRSTSGAGQEGARSAGEAPGREGSGNGGVAAAAPAAPGGGDAGSPGAGAGESGPIAGQAVAAARPEVRQYIAAADLHDIHFDFDRYEIKPDAARLLDVNAEWLKANPNHELLIEGHADERGTNEYNLALGEHRAKSAMNYLIAQGVQSDRLTIISYGEERPTCADKTEDCWGEEPPRALSREGALIRVN